MRQELCICDDIGKCRESLNLQTRVVVLMHHRERYLTTNTARLAQEVLPLCEIRYRGLQGHPLEVEGILDEHRAPLFLYPSEDSKILDANFVQSLGPKPVTLIVPDGSWRQASKVYKRESFLKDVPCVRLEAGPASQYQLRREPKAEGLATFEAIARAIGVLEGHHIRQELEALFQTMVSRTISSRNGIVDLEQIHRLQKT
jgi:DTW domain-containing protein YfiP